MEREVLATTPGGGVSPAGRRREEGSRTLARELLEISDDAFRVAFNGSPMKRAKLAGLKRNATVVAGNIESRRRDE